MPPAPDAQALELLRQRSGLSIDDEGRLCHGGEPITHRRTLEVLWGSLRRAEDGRYLVSVGRESGYVAVFDAPYGVRGVELEGREPAVHLTDGSVEALDPSTLSVDAAGVLHCIVKGSHRARFTRSAQIDLGLALEEDPQVPGRFVLEHGGRSYPIQVERR